MWKTEKEFGQYIMAKLSKEGAKCIRIESASTISGMPDMYVMGKADDYFVELKNMKDKSIKDYQWKIQWRPGQQGWALVYKDYHTRRYGEEFVKSKHTWTFVGLKDGVLLIRMAKLYQNNCVGNLSTHAFKFTKEQFSKINLAWFLRTYTYIIKPYLKKEDTWYDFLSRWATYILNECFGGAYSYDIDLPTPEEYIDDLNTLIPQLTVEKLNEKVNVDDADIIESLIVINKYLSEMVASIYNSYLNL